MHTVGRISSGIRESQCAKVNSETRQNKCNLAFRLLLATELWNQLHTNAPIIWSCSSSTFTVVWHHSLTGRRTSILLYNLDTSCFKAHIEESAIFKVHCNKLRKLLVANQSIRIPVIIGQPDCLGVEESQSQPYPNPLTHTKGEIRTHILHSHSSLSLWNF